MLRIRRFSSAVTSLLLTFSTSDAMIRLALGATWSRQRAPSEVRCQALCAVAASASSTASGSSPGRSVPAYTSGSDAPGAGSAATLCRNTVRQARVARRSCGQRSLSSATA